MSKKQNFNISFLSAFLLMLAVLSCNISDSNSRIRIGTNTWPGYEPLYMARHLKYQNPNEVQLLELPSASQVIRAYRNGRIDAAALTLDEVLILKENGYDPQIVLVMDISDGADVIIGQPQFKHFRDLRNKRIGVESNALGAFVLSRALTLSQMKNTEIKVVPLELNEHENAYNKKQVDAIVTFDPIRSRLIKKGGRILFSSKQIPNEIVDVLVVKKEFLKKNRASVVSLIGNWYKTLKYIENNREQSLKHIASRLSLTPQEVDKSYEGLKLPSYNETLKLLTPTEPGSLQFSAAKLAKEMQQTKLLKTSPDIKSLFIMAPGVLQAVKPLLK